MPNTAKDFNARSATPATPWGRRAAKTNEPYYDSVSVAAQLRKYDRRPFIDLLAKFMELGPTDEDIHALAARSPEKWAQAIRGLASLAGFAERVEIDHNINLNIGRMSDSQLEDALRKELEGEATEIPPDEPEALESAEAQQERGSAPQSADRPLIGNERGT